MEYRSFGLTFTIIISAFVCSHVSGQCAMNGCLCEDDLILCDEQNESEPTFTDYERQFARRLSLSLKQKPIIAKTCRLLPQVRYVEITHNERLDTDPDTFSNKDSVVTSCPRIPCRRVKVVCL
jgi:hypothetical protein